MEKDHKFFIGLFDKLGSKLKMLFDNKLFEDKKNINSINSNLQSIEKAVKEAQDAVNRKSNEDIIKSIEILKKIIDEKELSVNIEAPIVNVPEPKVIQETKEAKESNEILNRMLKALLKQLEEIGNVKITNSTPSEAIPVVLTNRQRKNFYEISNQIVTAISEGSKSFFDETNLDSFGRLRVSNPETLFDSKQINDDQSLFWDDQEISGGGTNSVYNTNKASTTISVSENTAGKRVRQTFMRFNYQPGKSQFVILTGTFGTRTTGVIKRFGAFDDQNGIFLEQDENEIYIVKRSYITGSAVDTKIPQSQWNVDILNGQGESKRLLDDTKSQILVLDYEWLGVGSVRVGFVINGKIIYAHKFHHSNISSGVYTSTPNYPLRYEITASGTNDAGNLEQICSSVISEGGTEDLGSIFSADTSTTTLDAAVAGTRYALVGIRLKSTHLDEIVKLINLSIIILSNQNIHWELYSNPTVAGTFTYNSINDESGVEYAVGVTANTVTGGIKLASGYASSGQRVANDELVNARRLGSAIDGTPDEFVLSVQPFNNNTLVAGAINFREIA